MTIEDYASACKTAKQRNTGRELVDEVHVVLWRSRPQKVRDQVQLSCIRKEDVEFALVGARNRWCYGMDTECS